MAGLKHIRRRLHSVKNTRQITRAMKLVSAAKLNRAQIAVTRSRDYADALSALVQQTIAVTGRDKIAHPLMAAREEVKNVRLIVVGGSRGLCGAYNTNLNKQIERLFIELPNKLGQGVNIDSVLIGKKPAEHFRRVKRPFAKSYESLPENPNLWPIEEVSDQLEHEYIEGRADQVYLVYTKFLSIMSQRVVVEQLLPFDIKSNISGGQEILARPYVIFEPSAKDIFANLIPRLVRVKIQQACLEARASEHASRMTAMDSATRNAGDLIDKLQLLHNRLRQSGITSELLDIVGGAEAIS